MGEQGSTSRSLMMELELGRDTTASTFPTAVSSMSTIMPMTSPDTSLGSPMMELLHSLLLLLDMVLLGMLLPPLLSPPQLLLLLLILLVLLVMVLAMSLVKNSRTEKNICHVFIYLNI